MKGVPGLAPDCAIDKQSLVYYLGADNLIFAVADWQQIFKTQPEKVVPTVAFDIIVFVGIIAAGALVRKFLFAVYVNVGLLEIARLNNGIQKQLWAKGI